jgi:GT2 family glycosyltransferase
MNTIAVLLTCHNRREKTVNCLKSLYNCSLPENHHLDVYLVDDGSSDRTSAAVRNEFPQVQIILGNGELFWNRGMYLAWETASAKKDYEFYLWLNDDTFLTDKAMQVLLDCSYKTNQQSIVVGITSSAISNDITYGGFNFPGILLQPTHEMQRCDYFCGNIVLIPNRIYKKVGNLDYLFRHTLGDNDYALRCNKYGMQAWTTPTVIGHCEIHERVPVWRNKEYSILKRVKHLYTPLGNNPIEHFIFDKRHFGLLVAMKHFFSIHLRTVFPMLWKNVS